MAGATSDPDLILIERAILGDKEAFESLFARHYDRVYAIARGVLLDADEAADAAQEIFTAVLKNLKRFDRRSRFSTWLYRVAVNRSIQHSRKLGFRRRLVPLDQTPETGLPVQTNDEHADPAIEAAMVLLSPSDRAVLSLFYWDDLSINEMADALDCSPNAAKVRLFRARERFRAAYEEVT
ncbi:MAG: RNA polymerase sigma factor [Fimbriimonadaceae bacterium]|nr:RNA polymerase sigma factor [Fimbriimonadaceae bacterium]